ncbi:hypothetical protein D7S86_18715 [Pararobbsia silviterrae]|uniref:Uncharacterized protein n=1 Tax=Pararobbsia silviterrae TaxID=1792498 RepID=A0A494XPV8_9BURK|nr:hypothetical protein D7S86_18715 [Pararobbsia silviterrae]
MTVTVPSGSQRCFSRTLAFFKDVDDRWRTRAWAVAMVADSAGGYREAYSDHLTQYRRDGAGATRAIDTGNVNHVGGVLGH